MDKTKHDKVAEREYKQAISALKKSLAAKGIKLCLDDLAPDNAFCICPECSKTAEEVAGV